MVSPRSRTRPALLSSSAQQAVSLRRTTLVVVAAAGSGGDGRTGKPVARAAAAARLPYEQARDELIELVKQLEAGGLSLEESLRLWERGEELAAICEEWLEGARARLATALARQENGGGTPGAPF
jgi:exodeoxyribonuclease VII small subunit